MYLETKKNIIATAQAIKYARFLAGNEQRIRDRALKSLRKLFKAQTEHKRPFSDADLLVIWKGLFYTLWMSDKPLIQEECCEKICELMHLLHMENGIHFFRAGLTTLCNEWHGIDQWRIDKFQMLVRRLVRYAIQHLKDNEWNATLMQRMSDAIERTVLACAQQMAPLSLTMHFSDIYLPEVAKVGGGALPGNALRMLIAPFARCLANSSDERVLNAIADNIFRYLIKQSTIGLQFEEKFDVWKQLGFPGGHINALQRANEQDLHDLDEMDEEMHNEDVEEEKTALDARAGRVNVVLPQLEVNCGVLLAILNESKRNSRHTKARAVLSRLIADFGKLDKGEYPYGMQRVDVEREDKPNVRKAAKQLIEFENKLHGKQKKRKRVKDDEELENVLRETLQTAQELQTRKTRLLKHNLYLKSKKQRLEKEMRCALGAFERNSGTWFVYEPDSDCDSEASDSPAVSNGKSIDAQPPTRLLFGGSVEKMASPTRALRGKARYFCEAGATLSPKEKKVKIDLRLNRSQEIYEHVAQLRNSPAIPFDAARSPGKSLMKPSPVSSPINPFYNHRSHIL